MLWGNLAWLTERSKERARVGTVRISREGLVVRHSHRITLSGEAGIPLHLLRWAHRWHSKNGRIWWHHGRRARWRGFADGKVLDLRTSENDVVINFIGWGNDFLLSVFRSERSDVLQRYFRFVGVDAIEDALIPDLILGDQANATTEVRDGAHVFSNTRKHTKPTKATRRKDGFKSIEEPRGRWKTDVG